MKAKYIVGIGFGNYLLCLIAMYAAKETNWFWIFLVIQAVSVLVATWVMSSYPPNKRWPR